MVQATVDFPLIVIEGDPRTVNDSADDSLVNQTAVNLYWIPWPRTLVRHRCFRGGSGPSCSAVFGELQCQSF